MITPTEQQVAIVQQSMKQETFKVGALAGTGKSTVSELIARENKYLRIGYMVFNKSASIEGEKRNPPNVDSFTGHKAAYAAVIKPRRLYKRLENPSALVQAIEEDKVIHEVRELAGGNSRAAAFWVVNTMEQWCNSEGGTPSGENVPDIAVSRFEKKKDKEAARKQIAKTASVLWDSLWETGSQLPLTHGHYMKLWSLSEPELPYDILIVDEAQDTNAPVMSVVNNQKCPVIALGDEFQAIYAWRNAINAMQKLPGETLPLTESWRFGEEIAAIASEVLGLLGSEHPVIGRGPQGFVLNDPHEYGPGTVLCRSNSAVIEETILALDEKLSVAVVGGTGEAVSLMYSAWDLYQGRTPRHPEIAMFTTWKEMADFSETEEGRVVRPLVTTVYKYLGGIPRLCARLKNEVQRYEGNAEVIVSTSHKAKGRQFDRVRLCEDFPSLVIENKPGEYELDKPEANLIYVAMTRAKRRLNLGGYGQRLAQDMQLLEGQKITEAWATSSEKGGSLYPWIT